MIFRSVRLMGALLVVFSCLSCVPWVVRPIDDSEQDEETGREVLDAELYVASIWDERVIPAVENEAVEIQDAAGGSECRLVRGEGKIVRVDRESRAGRLFLDLPPYGGGPDAVLQIGPLVRGMALRDSLPFIQFSDFLNQLDFAKVGNELNAHVENRVLQSISWNDSEGGIVQFAGAFCPVEGKGLPEVTPLRLSLERPAP